MQLSLNNDVTSDNRVEGDREVHKSEKMWNIKRLYFPAITLTKTFFIFLVSDSIVLLLSSINEGNDG